MASATTLSAHDSNVLSSILNPESLPTTTPIDPSLPPLPHIPLALLPILQSRETTIIRLLGGVSPPSSEIHNAIASLTSLIIEQPNYASAYNNRAQAIRMLFGDNLRTENVSKSTLWTDLEKAIELASPQSSYAAVSSTQAKTLASAYTHRGHLIWQLAKSMHPLPTPNVQPQPTHPENREPNLLPPELRSKSKERLEEIASHDFEMGGRYGNEIAREMATRTNPYAKLCGNIVKEAMRGELEGRGG